MGKFTQIAEVMHEMMGYFPTIPEPNCSCHINPPCNDCVSYSHQRYLELTAQDMIKELKAYDLLDQ